MARSKINPIKPTRVASRTNVIQTAKPRPFKPAPKVRATDPIGKGSKKK